MGVPPRSKATELDQIPESLFPRLLAAMVVPLPVGNFLAVLLVFLGGEIVLSRALYLIGLREQPYWGCWHHTVRGGDIRFMLVECRRDDRCVRSTLVKATKSQSSSLGKGPGGIE